ncbi:hypothetical protein ADUPG1_005737, partial [Aduncisulcus paluster]
FPNSCPLNDSSSSAADTYSCSGNTDCPSIVLNEVYNDIEEVKQCAWIAKEGDNGECYTIHDDNVRSYLTNTPNLTTESNGILTIPTLRGLTSAIDLSGIASSVTSLQGLEYVVKVTSLTLDGYDLSGDDADAEYD